MRKFMLMALLSITVMAGTLVLPMGTAMAATAENCGEGSVSAGGRFLGFPTWYKYLNPQFNDATKECELNFDFPEDIGAILLAVFEIVLRIGALAAVIFVIYGGFQYMLSQGNPDQAKAARGTIINALIGLAIAISATAIVNLIANGLV